MPIAPEAPPARHLLVLDRQQCRPRGNNPRHPERARVGSDPSQAGNRTSITATPVLIDAHLLLRFVTKLLENAPRYNLPQGRIGNELDPVPDAELHEYPPDVSLDGRLAEVQLLANLGVRQATHDQPHDLAFPAGEQVKPAGGAMSGSPGGPPTRMSPGHARGVQSARRRLAFGIRRLRSAAGVGDVGGLAAWRDCDGERPCANL